LEISNQFANQEAQSEDLNITDTQDQKENVSITETYFAQDCSIEIPQGVVENVEIDTTIEIDCDNKVTKLEVVTDSQENLLFENKKEIQEISSTPDVFSDEKEDKVIPVKRARLNRIEDSEDEDVKPVIKKVKSEIVYDEPLVKETVKIVEDLQEPGTSQAMETDVKAEQTGQDTADSSDEEDDIDKILSDIDLNSLVLVEKQTSDNRTIHEIYVMDPNTEELSEEPLNLPPEIIESIRKVVENEET
jgi:hypothetical protein